VLRGGITTFGPAELSVRCDPMRRAEQALARTRPSGRVRGVHPYLTTPGAGLSIWRKGGERDGCEEHPADEREGCVGCQQGVDQPEGEQGREVGCRQRVVADAEAEAIPGRPPFGEGRYPGCVDGAAPLDLKEARVKRTVDNSFTKLDENLNLDPFVRQPALSMTGRRR
jgi:hypothetical protein